jgi:two-component system sensor histidine kinase DevS
LKRTEYVNWDGNTAADAADIAVPHFIAPVRLLVVAIAFGLLVSSLMIWIALHQPWLGLTLQLDAANNRVTVTRAQGPSQAIPAGTQIASIAGASDRIDFAAMDFTIEPAGGLATFQDHATFLARQDRIAHIVASDRVDLVGSDGRHWQVTPQPARPVSNLPVDFWVQIFVGFFAWTVSASVWVFRPQEASARYLLLTGLSTLVFASFAAVYSTRELALPALLFRTLNDLNFLGGSLFAAGLVSLLLYYPRRLAPRWVGLAVVGVFVVWFVAQEIGLFTSMTIARRLLVMMALVATFVLAGIHWAATRADPIARAALQWFLLSWLAGASIFGFFILLPQMFGVDTSFLQGYGFTLFLLVYAGLAFGILRFRLFSLGDWWARSLLWIGSVVVLIGLDLAFVFGLQLSGDLSLALSLLICGLIWLPLRGWIWSRVFRLNDVNDRTLFKDVITVALAPRGQAQTLQWRRMLEQVFEPLNIDRAGPVGAAALEQDGLALVVPAVDTLPAMRLRFARGGRRLFGPGDARLAGQLADMLSYAIESRASFEAGAAQERSRIASDIHDNVGARLLSALHSDGEARKNGLISESLADLRSIVNDAASPGASLAEALANLRYETAERLAAQNIALDWPVADLPERAAPTSLIHTLRSIIRECASNTLKHARASRLSVRIEIDRAGIALVVSDDGIGFDTAKTFTGHGLAIMRRRVAAVHGDIEWTTNGEGQVQLKVRLDANPASEQDVSHGAP